MEKYFHVFLFQGDFAYALFGAKPLSMDVIQILEYIPGEFPDFSNAQMRQYAHEVLKAYLPLFSSENFFLKETVLDEDTRRVILVCKPLFRQTVKEHLGLFQNILKKAITPESLLFEIEHSERDIMEILHHHEGLFGILLGYGKENALMFHYRGELEKSIKALKISIKSTILPRTSVSLLQLKEKHERVNRLLYFPLSDIRSSIHYIKPVTFAAKKSQETNNLLVYYEHAREIIGSQFIEGNILEKTHEQIHSKKPLFISKKAVGKLFLSSSDY